MSDDTPSDPIERLRQEIDRDTRILGSLTPGSDAHRRMAASIEQRTTELMDKIDAKDDMDRRSREALRAEYARSQARKLTPEQETRYGGALFVAIGIVVGYFTWGSWWVLIAVGMVGLGLLGVLSPSERS